MSRLVLTMLLVGGMTAAAAPPINKLERLDAHGDPLPDGALARLGTVRFRGQFQGVALSPDGKTLAVGNYQALQLFDVATGKPIKTIANAKGGNATGLTFSPDGKILAEADHTSGIQLWDIATGQVLRRLAGERSSASSPVFSADGRHVTTGTDYFGQGKSQVRVWEVATGKEVAAVEPLQNHNVRTSLSGDGKLLATWGHVLSRGTNRDEDMKRLRTVQIWDVGTGKEMKKLELPQQTQVSNAALSRDGKRIVICAAGLLTLWDVATGKELDQFAARRGTHSCLFSPDGKTLIGVSAPLAVQLWDVDTGKRLGMHEVPGGVVSPYFHQVTVTPDNRLLGFATTGQAVTVWDLRAEKRLTPVGGHEMSLHGLNFTEGGRSVLSLGADGTVCRWDVATGKEQKRHQVLDDDSLRLGGRIRFARGSVTSSLVSPDGQYLLTTEYNGSVLWELATGREICSFAGGQGNYGTLAAFSTDGSRLALGARDLRGQGGTILVFNVHTGRRSAELQDVLEQPTGLAFAPDGRMVVAASMSTRGNGQNEVRAWDVATGKSRWVHSHPGYLQIKLAFSPDSQTVAQLTPTNQVSLLSATSGEEQRRLGEAGTGAAYLVQFSPDGRMLATVAYDTNQHSAIRIYELATGTLRRKLTGHAGHLTCLAFGPDGSVLASGSHDTTVLLWDTTGRLGLEKPKEAPTEKELATWWDSLDAAEAQTALAAMARLQLSPNEAVTLLGKQLAPVQGAKSDAATIAALVADLDHARFARRDKAQRDLEQLGKTVEAELRKGLQGMVSAEKKKRIGELLQKLETAAVKPEWVRPLRGVEVLERIGSDEARKILEKLASGAPGARLTEEAKTVLARLKAPGR